MSEQLVLALDVGGSSVKSALIEKGQRVVDESFLLLFNAHYEQIEFKLPTKRFGARWQFALSTADPDVADGSRSYVARAGVPVESRSVLVLRRGW